MCRKWKRAEGYDYTSDTVSLLAALQTMGAVLAAVPPPERRRVEGQSR
jgi:hypothetical protein